MPSKVANAVGVAQQYMPQEKETYKARLQGVQLNWNVTPEYDNTTGKTAQALEALGVRLGGNELENEKFNYEYANLYARQLYNQLSDKEKKTLTAQQMVTFYGSYKLADNKYATAIIDEMRGEQLNQEAHSAYLDWIQTQPQVATEQEEMDRNERFMKEWQDKQFAENNNVIMNTHAFLNGYTKRTLEQRTQVSNLFYERREQEQLLTRNNGILSRFSEVLTNNRYTGLTKDQWLEQLTPICEEINSTSRMRSNPKNEFTLFDEMAKTIALQIGSREALEAFGEMTLANGKQMKELVNINGYTKLADQTAHYYRTQEDIEMDKYFQSFTNPKALEQDLEKMMKEDPKKYSRYAPHAQQQVERLRVEEKRRQERMLKQRGIQLDATTQMNLAESVINGIISGKFGESGFTPKMLKDKGLSIQVLAQYLFEKMPSMSDEQVAYIMNQPVMADFHTYFDQYLPTALASGDYNNPALQSALRLAKGIYAKQALGKHADDVLALQHLIKTHGVEAGLPLFVESQRKFNDPETKQQAQNAYNNLGTNPKVYSYTIVGDSMESTELTAHNAPPNALGEIKDLALRLYVSGVGMATAQKQATDEVMKKWVHAYDGVWLPRGMYQELVGDNSKYTNRQLADVIKMIAWADGSSNSLTVGQDTSGWYIRTLDNRGNSKKYYTDNLLNELEYVSNYQGKPDNTGGDVLQALHGGGLF